MASCGCSHICGSTFVTSVSHFLLRQRFLGPDLVAEPIKLLDDALPNGNEEKIDVSKVDVSMNGIELQDREFFAAIRDGREPNASVAQVLPCYEMLHRLEQQLAA